MIGCMSVPDQGQALTRAMVSTHSDDDNVFVVRHTPTYSALLFDWAPHSDLFWSASSDDVASNSFNPNSEYHQNGNTIKYSSNNHTHTLVIAPYSSVRFQWLLLIQCRSRFGPSPTWQRSMYARRQCKPLLTTLSSVVIWSKIFRNRSQLSRV